MLKQVQNDKCHSGIKDWFNQSFMGSPMLKIKNARFVKSILDGKEKPKPAMPEVVFAGRSNVGKSSLINSLVNQRNFARVSKKPGKTQTINFFNIDDRFYLVDLPGYGYANRSKAQQSTWNKGIEDYLINSRELMILLALIDSKVGVKENDKQLIEWLEHIQIPFRIIATKVDQISRSEAIDGESQIRESLGLSPDNPIIFYSVKNRTGRETVLKYLADLLKQLE
jgi:GTP-binding protein